MTNHYVGEKVPFVLKVQFLCHQVLQDILDFLLFWGKDNGLIYIGDERYTSFQK